MRIIKHISQIIMIFISIVGLLILAYLFSVFLNHNNDIKILVNYQPKLTTRIFDKNDELLANVFEEEHRIFVPIDDIPPRLIETILAVEDTNFFNHSGVNFDGILRAIYKNIKAGRKVEGASTITQQVVRNVLNMSRLKSYERKIKEILLSLWVETRLTKEQILEIYINHVFLGHGYYGFKTASLGYFNKELDELNLKEMAMLAALPKSPTKYNPTRNPNNSYKRADTIIKRMYNLGWTSKDEYLQYKNIKPTIFDVSLTQNIAPYVVDEVLRQTKEFLDTDVKTGGYEIYTTIDPYAQAFAKKALKKGYHNIIKSEELRLIKDDLIYKEEQDKLTQDEKDEYLKQKYSHLNGAMVVLEPSSGKILALVGGVDYKKSSFNRATMAKRQIGSSVKPFIYMHALNLGYHSKTQIAEISRIYGKKEKSEDTNKEISEEEDDTNIWKPKNYSGTFRGYRTLEEGLIRSSNLITINLVEDAGFYSMYKNLKKVGFEDIPQDLSIVLGSISDTVVGLSGKFTLFSNYGVKTSPILITRIKKLKEETINFIPVKEELIKKKQAFLMVNILNKVVKMGTGRRARVQNCNIAGKTGTTNKNIDVWFNGFTPKIQATVWYGNDDNKPIGEHQAGGKSAAPVFREFLKMYLKKYPSTRAEFRVPYGVKMIKKGEEEIYYTDQSPIPNQENSISILDEEVMF